MTLRSLLFMVFAVGLSGAVFPAESSAQTTSWTFCASEGGTCSFSGTQQVRYGANGLYATRTLTGGTACTNAVFGDPAPGVAKHCDTGGTTTSTSTTWTFCANEGGTCAFSGTTNVRYGANGLYATRTLTGGTACTNTVFGDPAPGVAKHCDTGGTSTSSSTPTGTWTFCANEGGTCAFSGTLDVRYGGNGLYATRTLTGGTACTNAVFGDPAPGVAKHCDTGAASSSTTPSSPSLSTAYGPQSTITCPAGAISISPGQPIQTNVNNYPGGTTFCLRAGTHYVTSAITPKTGDTFVGEYGAILDGSNWSTSDSTQAAFRAHNQDIDYVTIRNLVIRKMPQKGIHVYYWLSPDHWTIEYSEIAENRNGILFGSYSTIRNNYIHHNYGDPASTDPAVRGGGYGGYSAVNSVIENNEIAYNGKEQKVMESQNVTFRNNFVHHNQGDGIWYDGGNPGALVEGNRVEDNARNGIFYEASNGSIIRNNTIRRSGDTAVFISASQNSEIYGNTVEDNFRAITYFVDCGSLVGRDIDLANNWTHDNTMRVGTQSGAFAAGLLYTSACTATQVTTYNTSKNNRYTHNAYIVPNVGGWYWYWNGTKQWYQWQGVPQDADGTVSQ